MEIKSIKIHAILMKIGISKRILLMMMRTFIFLLCTTVFSLNTDITNAQEKVKIDQDKVMTVDEVFDMIIDQTKYSFLYPTNLFKDIPNVQVKKGVMSVGKLLQKTLPKGKFNVILGTDNKITIKQKSQTQQRQITGKVTDEKGLPVSGATVLIKGTTKGTATDFDGVYTITVPDPASVLVFSFLGFADQEVIVGNQTTINVSMKESVSLLGEVVVSTGYWKTEQKLNPGNIAKVEAKTIAAQPVANPLASLPGRMAGVSVVQNTGVPGGNFTVRIRGQNSIRSEGNEPLYIVNGVPFPATSLTSTSGSVNPILTNNVSPFSSIDPANIESIEVLKDADATAIYGSRGANGVVLITTKRGVESGKLKVNINYSAGFGEVANKVDLLNSSQYEEMVTEGFLNSGIDPDTFPEEAYIFFPSVFLWDFNRNTDWQDVLIGGTAETSNLQVSVSGGGPKTQFLIGAGYYTENTVFPLDGGQKRGSFNFNMNHQSTDRKFTANFSVNFVADILDLPPVDFTRDALRLQPNAPALFDDNGELNFENDTFNNNPLTLRESVYESNTKNLVSNLVLRYQILPDLYLKANMGYTSIQTDLFGSSPLSAVAPSIREGATAASRFSDGSIETWIIEPQLEYNRQIGGGKLSILAGGTFQENISKDNFFSATGYTSDALLRNIQAAPQVNADLTNFIQYRYNAIFGRVNYNWKNRYIINLTGRRDGSTRFGPGNQFANFGAVGTAWVFSNEGFIKKSLPFLSFGKFRASYGTNGSDQTPDYGFLDTFESTRFPYQGRNGLIPTRLSNPNFGWESSEKLEYGLELGLFKDRIFLSSSRYRNQTTNQLVGLPLPRITGQPSIQFNLPATVENSGWEFDLTTTNIKTDSFSWTTGFNLTLLDNELVEYPNIESSPFANRRRVGESLFIVGGLEFLGVNPETGIYQFEDVDGNGSGTDLPEDLQFNKELGQEYFGGLQNTFSYKGFELNVFFQFVKQTGLNFLAGFPAPGQPDSNQPIEVMDRWQQPGDITNIQSFSLFGDPNTAFANFSGSSDGRIVDASFIRLRNVQLSWQLPSKILDQIGIEQARIFFQGQNLLTFTNYLGLDPENFSTTALPPLRTISSGIQLTF